MKKQSLGTCATTAKSPKKEEGSEIVFKDTMAANFPNVAHKTRLKKLSEPRKDKTKDIQAKTS